MQLHGYLYLVVADLMKFLYHLYHMKIAVLLQTNRIKVPTFSYDKYRDNLNFKKGFNTLRPCPFSSLPGPLLCVFRFWRDKCHQQPERGVMNAITTLNQT